ncbi:hypothetical protein Q7P37_004782 [Cladosporium fusiforme]
MPPHQHFPSPYGYGYGHGHGYSKPAMQHQAWPPPYYHAHSYQPPTAFQDQKPDPSYRKPTPTTPPIQPDPLPPHSNPAQLSPTQSRAFQGPMPTAPVRLAKHDVLNAQTGQPILAISKEAVHMPSFLSSKPLLTVRRCDTNAQLGTIRFHNMTTSDIELQINGRASVLSSSGLLHTRWMFHPTSTTGTAAKSGGHAWYWQRDKSVKRCVVLTDAKKHGNVIARMEKDVLSFEKVGLSSETLDEIVLTAVALAENVRRHKGGSAAVDGLDVAACIADGGGGSSGGDGGGGGGGGSC